MAYQQMKSDSSEPVTEPILISTGSSSYVPNSDPSSAEYLHSQRKCKRCEHLYTNAEASQCHYHPGTFVDTNKSREGAMVGWSCCRIEGWQEAGALVKAQFGGAVDKFSIINPDAMNRDCKGCKTAPAHEEDPTYSAAISTFPFHPDGLPIALPAPETAATADTAKTPEDEQDKDEGAYLRHPVSRGDTLAGLSLKYGVPVQLLKTVNKIPPMVQDVYQYKVLLIPTSLTEPIPANVDNNSRANLVRVFKNATKASTEEARFYLDEHDNDLAAALKKYQEDADFEANADPSLLGGRAVRVDSPKPAKKQKSSKKESKSSKSSSKKAARAADNASGNNNNNELNNENSTGSSMEPVPRKRKGLLTMLCPNFVLKRREKRKARKAARSLAGNHAELNTLILPGAAVGGEQ